jgi:hypothetical protein
MMVRLYEIVQPNDQRKLEDVIAKYFLIPGEYTILKDGSVDVRGPCRLEVECQKMPIQFNDVTGPFICAGKKLTSLEGSPKACQDFSCFDNQLANLIGSPGLVKGSFMAHANPLVSIEGLSGIINEKISLPFLTDLPLLRLVGRSNSFVFKDGEEYYWEISKILEQYSNLKSRANIIACQKELIAAGFVGNASW